MAANWKMYKNAQQTAAFFEQFKPLLGEAPQCDVVVFPVSLSIPEAVKAALGSPIHIGGQNTYWFKEGAYTGEISADLLHAAGATWTLVGHSERRQRPTPMF